MIGTYIIDNPEKEIRKPDSASGAPAGGPPAGGPPAGGPPMGGPGGPGGGGGMPTGPLASELKLVWDGKTGIWTNEVSQEVVLDAVEATEDTLKFTAMAGPAPIEWTIRKDGDGYTAISHRGADIHGNPPVDTVCKVTRQD